MAAFCSEGLRAEQSRNGHTAASPQHDTRPICQYTHWGGGVVLVALAVSFKS